MAILDVSFLNPSMRKKTGGTGVQVLNNQLAMLENELKQDGDLSQGDYDILIDEARKIRLSGRLTATQQSTWDRKISDYETEKEILTINRSEDLQKMRDEEKKTTNDIVSINGNSPIAYLQDRTASLSNYINQLDNIIERREASLIPSVEYWNEREEVSREFDNAVEALSLAKGFDGENPISSYVAFVTTGANGEIIDIKYGRAGDESGFIETEGMVDGFQVYGKPNKTEDGNNVFILGNNRFSASNTMTFDPNNPLALKTNKLKYNPTQDEIKNNIPGINKGGWRNMQGLNLRIQTGMPRDSWSQGENGVIYYRHGDKDKEGYTQYKNYTPDQLPITGHLAPMPRSYEQAILPHVIDTDDRCLNQITPDQGLQELGPELPQAQYPGQPPSPFLRPQEEPVTPATARPTARTKSPVERAGAGLLPTAQRTIRSGVDYVKSLFG